MLILGSVAVTLSACGQKGPLVLPTGPAAASRATLPETLKPSLPSKADTPAAPASAPQSQ